MKCFTGYHRWVIAIIVISLLSIYISCDKGTNLSREAESAQHNTKIVEEIPVIHDFLKEFYRSQLYFLPDNNVDIDESLNNFSFFKGKADDIKKNVMNVSRMKIGNDTKLVLMQMPKSAIVFDKCYIPPESLKTVTDTIVDNTTQRKLKELGYVE